MAILDNFIAGYHLDEASGNALDVLAANDLTANNSPGTTTGKIGNCRTCDNDTDKDFSSSSSIFQVGDEDCTWALWFRTSVDFGRFFGKNTQGGLSEYSVSLNGSGGVGLNIENSPAAESVSFGNAGLFDGNLHFLICGHDATNNLLFITVDNAALNTVSYSDGVLAGSADFHLGSRDGTDFLTGDLDEFGFWKRVLTSGERTLLWNGGAGLAYPFVPPILTLPKPYIIGQAVNRSYNY